MTSTLDSTTVAPSSGAASLSRPTVVAAPASPRSSRVWSYVLPVLGIVVFVGAWEWTGRAGAFGNTWLPLSDIWAEFGVPGRAPLIRRAAAATFTRAGTGLVVGFSLALVMASVAAMIPRVRSAINGASVAVNSVPWVALGPLLMIVVSRDVAPAVIAGLAVFFPSFVSITAGLSGANADQEDLCSALGMANRRRFRLVRLPNALPSFIVGLKLAVPAAIIGAIFGEWFGAERGLGLLLLTSMQTFKPGLLWAVGLLAAGVTMVSYGLLSIAEVLVARRFSLATRSSTVRPAVRARRWRAAALWAAVGVGLVVLWQLFVSGSGVSALLVPGPGRVWRDFAADPWLYASNAWITVRMGVLGLVIGVMVGAVLAIISWWSRFLRGLLTPFVLVARSVPALALLPVVAGILGYNDRSILAIAVLISFFPSYVYVSKGLREVPDGAADLMAVLGSSRGRVFRLIALPASLRELAVALRLSAGVCVIAAVAAEFLIGERGLGRLFAESMGRQNIDRAWAVALVIVAVSIAAFAAASAAERAIVDRLS